MQFNDLKPNALLTVNSINPLIDHKFIVVDHNRSVLENYNRLREPGAYKRFCRELVAGQMFIYTGNVLKEPTAGKDSKPEPIFFNPATTEFFIMGPGVLPLLDLQEETWN